MIPHNSDYRTTGENTYVSTIFCVYERLLESSHFRNTWRPLEDITRNAAKYSWIWQTRAFGKYKPTWLKVWPWLLLIVMAKHTCTGNWGRDRSKQGWVSDGTISVCGIKHRALTFRPDKILASITLRHNFVTTSLVLYHYSNWLNDLSFSSKWLSSNLQHDFMIW